MTRESLTQRLLKPAAVLAGEEPVVSAVRKVLDSGLPALPVVDWPPSRRRRAPRRVHRDAPSLSPPRQTFLGLFGEREFLRAMFPGYVSELHSASFMPASFDESVEQRAVSYQQPVRAFVTTGHVEVSTTASDVEVAEKFLHQRVLVLPVVEDGAIVGVVTRRDFANALAEELLERAARAAAES